MTEALVLTFTVPTEGVASGRQGSYGRQGRRFLQFDGPSARLLSDGP